MAVKLVKEAEGVANPKDQVAELVHLLSEANNIIQTLDEYHDMHKYRYFNKLYKSISSSYDISLYFQDEIEGKK